MHVSSFNMILRVCMGIYSTDNSSVFATINGGGIVVPGTAGLASDNSGAFNNNNVPPNTL